MPTDIAALLANQSTDELKPIVSQIVGEDTTPTGELTLKKISRSAGQGTAGIFQVTGHARTKNGSTEWTAVVKALGTPEFAVSGLQDNALREVEIYRSGAFAELCGGVRAARCYGIQSRDDLQLLWLEDLSAAPQPPWNADQFIATARNLGQFNAYWPENALPQWEWLSQRKFNADFTQKPFYRSTFNRIPEHLDHPVARSYASPDVVKGLNQYWDECDGLLIRAQETSRGVCHLDCHPKNLFPMHNAGAEKETSGYTIAIDWVDPGISNLGIDVGHMLASPLVHRELRPEEAASLRDPIFDAYLSGLADSGWAGDKDSVRFTYLTRLACEVIRQTNLIFYAIDNAQLWASLERSGVPMAEISARLGANLPFFFDCKDEALRLAARL